MNDETRPDIPVIAHDGPPSKLVQAGDDALGKLIRAVRSVKIFIVILAVVIVALVGIAIGGLKVQADTQRAVSSTHALTEQVKTTSTANQVYTDQLVQHACEALELLTVTPIHPPADPKANPSREANYRFYVSLLHWEKGWHCHRVK